MNQQTGFPDRRQKLKMRTISRKTILVIGLMLAALMLAACGSVRASIPDAATSEPASTAPEESAAPVPVSTPVPEAPAPSAPLLPRSAPADTRPDPLDPEETSSSADVRPDPLDPEERRDPASQDLSPAPTLPRVTKSPTDETVEEGGSCLFLAKYENAEYAVWHFVSPDGLNDMTYEAAQAAFPTMQIRNGMYSNLQLGNIPYAVNGWKVYCRYSNTDAGYVDTAMAQITVVRDPSQAFTAAQPAVRRAGFEGEWAEESSGLCRILFTWHDESSWYVGIIRRDTSGLRDCWNMTGKFYSDGVLVYDDGHHWTETYSNDNSYETSNETWNGTGSFYLENGRLHWYNAQTGEELILVPA